MSVSFVSISANCVCHNVCQLCVESIDIFQHFFREHAGDFVLGKIGFPLPRSCLHFNNFRHCLGSLASFYFYIPSRERAFATTSLKQV